MEMIRWSDLEDLVANFRKDNGADPYALIVPPWIADYLYSCAEADSLSGINGANAKKMLSFRGIYMFQDAASHNVQAVSKETFQRIKDRLK